MRTLPHAIAALILAALLGFGALLLGGVAPHYDKGVPSAICVTSARAPQNCVE